MSAPTPTKASVTAAGPLDRALLIDDHQLLAHSLGLALGFEGITCTIPELTDRDSLMGCVLQAAPALVLLDLDLGEGVGNGATLVAPLVAAGCRVLVVSGSTDDDQICATLAAGAVGVVAKSAPFDELLATVLAVARGEEVMSALERASRLDAARRRQDERRATLAPFERLSTREAEVLQVLAHGQSVAAIATASVVSEATVRSQVRAVLQKLGVNSQLEAVAMAHRHRWL